MPIDISKMQDAVAAATVNSPKYFSKNLTGVGKSTGLLNDRKRPGRYVGGMSRQTAPKNKIARKERQYSGNITTQVIPFSPFFSDSISVNLGRGITLPVPESTLRFDLTDGKSGLDFDAYLDLVPQGALLVEDENGQKMQRHLDVKYRMEVHVLPHGAKQGTSSMVLATAPSPAQAGGREPFVLVDWSYAPLDDAYALIEEATKRHTPTGRGVIVDDVALAEWMDEYDLADRITKLADTWDSDEIGHIVSLHVQELFQNGSPTSSDVLNTLAAQLLYLETYNVPLSAYRIVHDGLQQHILDEDLRTILSNQNMQLLMNHVLDRLDQSKPNLPVPPRPQGQALQTIANQPGGGNAVNLSAQQRNAVDTDETLVLVQAGAGTGKSTVIIQRIENLVARGVDASDITVLSFTNAAADNITDRNPNVGSMTIAKMVHEIYQLNYPQHALSSVDTMLNSLDIFFPTDSFVEALRPRLQRVAQNKPGAMTELSNFIAKNMDRTIAVLTAIQQTCLEIEVIIAYHQIETMAEPAGIRSQYLIIDEVQDNSIFEFIYLLKYVTKHQENMFIVGDCSQTLYEFRSANPKALNALESSGVFATYQLTTNYRSNQEILDFANVALTDIEANRFAQIQLFANSLDQPTEASFREAVTLDYRFYKAKKGFTDEFPTLLRSKDSAVRKYIDARVAKGELIAFLAYSRADVKMMEDAMREVYPTKHIANLVSDKVYDSNAFSNFIKRYWNDVRSSGYQSAAYVAATQIKATLDTRGKQPKAVQAMENGVRAMIDEWWRQTHAEESVWKDMVAKGQLTEAQYFENLRDSLLSYEINHNSIRQRVVGLRNKDRKQADMDGNPDMIVSTVHGVKGLEFPHVVVIHNYDNQMSEDMKRLYYVAFTRARQSEFIASYGTVKNSKIEADYVAHAENLGERDLRTHLKEQGIDIDAMPEDEAEAALMVVRDARAAAAQKAAEDAASSANAQAIAEQGALPEGPTKATMAMVGAQGSGGGQDDDEPVSDGTAFTG